MNVDAFHLYFIYVIVGIGFAQVTINAFARQLFCGIAEHPAHRFVGQSLDCIEFGRICYQQSAANYQCCTESHQM